MPLKLSPTQLAFNARGDGKFSLPFQEQIDFFRQKLNLPTEHYDDILGAAHDRAFMVAGAAKADLLNDLRGAVDKAIADGKSIQWFRKEFAGIVQKNGWEGWTGSDTKAGRDWRTRVIYNTNIQTSYNAGRYAQLTDPDLIKHRPYWRYVHNDTVAHPRPLHQSWSGTVLRYDDPWWDTHFTPNGYGCRCRIASAGNDEYKGHPAPDDGTYEKVDRNGVVHTLPKGVDYGFDYKPGASVQAQMKGFVDNKAVSLPPKLGKAFKAEVASIKPSSLEFVPAKTSKDAGKWAVDNNLVDNADYSGVKVGVANDFNSSLFEHIRDFPELRKNQEFIGTIQAQFALFREQSIESYMARLRVWKPGVSDDLLRPIAEKGIKLRKTDNRYAQSWMQPGVKGVCVNKKWGADIDGFKSALAHDVDANWHPVGCDTVKSVVDHEFGHQLDGLLNLSGDSEIKAMFSNYTDGKQLSRYALRDIGEFVAEAWAEFRNNPSPGTVSARIGEVILDRYKVSTGHG